MNQPRNDTDDRTLKKLLYGTSHIQEARRKTEHAK